MDVQELLTEGSLSAIKKAVLDRKCSVRDIADWYVKRIEASRLNAVRVLSPRAMDDARQLDDEASAGRVRGPLHGVPVLLKDNILTGDGMTTSVGCAALLDFKAIADATVVRKLRSAGALILGKTNLTELADYVSDVMPSGFSSAGGTVINPHTKDAYGRGLGSSVGSAAAIAASLAPIALGTETQNSIQTPAIASSVYGFKPSVGRISRAGVVPLVPSQDSPGLLARSIEDIVCMFGVLAGADACDTASLPEIAYQTSPRRRDPATTRIGVVRRFTTDRADLQKELPLFEAALRDLSAAGATIIDPCDLPAAEQLLKVRSSVFPTEFKAALNGFLERNGAPCGIDSIGTLIQWNEARPDMIPFGQSLLIAAAKTTGLDNQTYIDDRRRDIVLSRQSGIDAALLASDADVLIAPMDAIAKCTGKAGAPVLAIPLGLDTEGLPFGITLIASNGDDSKLLDIGAAVAAIVGKPVALPL